jgi:hypothetical protein
VNLEACRNGIDDDGNGKIDCEDTACVEQMHCEAFAQSCMLFPQSGCPKGMGCYPDAPNSFLGARCALPGPTLELRSCNQPLDCAAGHECLGSCLRYCNGEADCLRHEYCARPFQDRPGTCLSGCIPAFGNAGCFATACVTAHQFTQRFGAAPTLAICGPVPQWKGLAARGSACDNPASQVKLERMCVPGLVCVDIAGSFRCADTCGFFADGRQGSACPVTGETCVVAFPQDTRPFRPEFPYSQGYCVPGP